MPKWVIVDTDVLIEAARGVDDAVTCLEQIENQASLAITVISEMELVIGCRNKAELRTLDRFLSRFQVLKLNEPISDIAKDLLRRYRLSHGLLIADALIAATALAYDIPFVTKNERDYRFIAGLRLLPYPQPFGTSKT
ncbi:MAG: type II toxin-antitoxin system VapC family toxin [Anaerolineae bacterium]|nr:type II toxin-antitoxin system VapC family toxin [Anaerolineae bacterium]